MKVLGAALAMRARSLNSDLLSLLGDIPFGLLLFGLPGVVLLLLSVWLFLKSDEKKF
jgi:hypothetical protein